MLFKNFKKQHQTNEAERINDGKTHVFNLIVLDESGSMSTIENEARSGCNEVLSGIRKAQEDHPELIQTISLLPFSTGEMKYIYENTPIGDTKDIAGEYRPGGMTALYDAMGYALTLLEKETDKYADAVGLVTVITDGYENSSHEYSGRMVYDLVERLQKKGWTFAFMGANQDVMEVAKSLHIKNAREFEYTGKGMTHAWSTEKLARERYWERLKKMHGETAGMSTEDKQAHYAQMETATNYYDED